MIFRFALYTSILLALGCGRAEPPTATTGPAATGTAAPGTTDPKVSQPTGQSQPVAPSSDGGEAGTCSVLGRLPARINAVNQFELTRPDYQRAVQTLADQLKHSVIAERAIPGRTAAGEGGIHLFGIGATAQCGFVNGDLVLRVNDRPLDKEAGFEDAEAWKAAKQLAVELERKVGGVPTRLRLVYRIVD